MSGNPSTTGTDQSSTSANANANPPTAAPAPSHSQPFVRPPPSQSFDPAAAFMEAYDCAKLNNNWNKVSSSLMIHPDWLSRIPQGRRWTMLHQIVFSGNVLHLNEVLALQSSNPEFRLLCKTMDDKTVREVAMERAHIHPQMMRRIERLVAVDQLLTNAKDRKWELVKQCISLQPDIVNEKPPYRQYYLAHHLACIGELDIFKDLSTVCHFKLDLLADNKTISQTARENNHIAFAEYVENLSVIANETTDDDMTGATPPSHTTASTHYSPGFYDDPGISFIPANFSVASMFLPTNDAVSYPGNHHTSSDDHIFATHSLLHGHTTDNTSNANHHHVNNVDHAEKSTESKSNAPKMTDDEQVEYEKTIMSNVQKMSHDNLINSITCCITKAILHDPVVASDGFTYEREAILNWFKHSTRSPMTNQELESLELKPNYAIKSILQLLEGTPNISHEKTDKK